MPEKRGRGKPSKYPSLDLEQVRKLAEAGWTDSQMAEFFGVVESTWYLWKVKHPEFKEMLKGWKDTADERVERSLYENAIGYTHKELRTFVIDGEIVTKEVERNYPPHATSAIFWLKNRKPAQWRDKQDIALGGEDGEPIKSALTVRFVDAKRSDDTGNADD